MKTRPRVFRSRRFGRMHKKARQRLGLGGQNREEVWRLMAAQEAKGRKAAVPVTMAVPAPWWKRLLRALCGAVCVAWGWLVSQGQTLRWRVRGARVRRRVATQQRAASRG